MKNTNYIFADRATYLEVRAEWKANYARLTIEARKLRLEFNEAQRSYSKTSTYAALQSVNTLRDARDSLRHEAVNELSELFQMKEEAQRQWELEHVTHPRVQDHNYPT